MNGRATPCVIENALGACTGERTCIGAILSECTAETPAEDVCDGVDNDCDGVTDSTPCDDSNSCTADSCDGTNGCIHIPLLGEPCVDPDLCTLEAGLCSNDGTCSAEPIECDDTDPCTADTCISGTGCVFIDNEQCQCAVDDDCPPPADRCLGINRCVITAALPYFHCALDPTTEVICEPSPEDSFCLASACEPATGLCIDTFQNQGAECADPNPMCEAPSTCKDGACVEGLKLPCDDGNACTTDVCDPMLGCTFTPQPEDACVDDNVCTADLGCSPTLGCMFTDLATDCDDGEDCTLDTCDPITGCQHIPQTDTCCEFGVSEAGFCLPELQVSAGPDQLVDVDAAITLTATATGGDSSYVYQWTNGMTIAGTGSELSLTATTTATFVVTVTDGVGNTASDSVTIQLKDTPLTLCDWDVVTFDPDGQTQPLAEWVFDSECTQASQILNAKPSVLLSPLDFESGTLTGQFRVETTADDDLIGFVFGWKNAANFYLMDWKQGGQTFCNASVFEGVSLKKVTGTELPLVCPDFFASQGTQNTNILQLAIPPGWDDFVTYQWTLTLNAGTATIHIAAEDTLIHTFTAVLPDFSGGRFGFYNNSQDSVTYEYFQFVQPDSANEP